MSDIKSEWEQEIQRKFDYNKCALETELTNFIEDIKQLDVDDLKTFDGFSDTIDLFSDIRFSLTAVIMLDDLLNPKKGKG